MTEQTARLLGAECSDHGIYEHGCRPDYFQWIGWSLVATGFIYYAWRFVS